MVDQVRKPSKGSLGTRVAVALLTVSASGFAAWKAHEGYTDHAVIPTKGDVPTIGHGSTHYEDGTKVRIGDTITRQRADELARNLLDADSRQFAATMPSVALTPNEFDLYMDFVGQYGLGTWQKSSMRRDLIASRYVAACNDLLKYRYAAGYDCSTLVHGKPNTRCWGSWERQKERNRKCLAEQR